MLLIITSEQLLANDFDADSDRLEIVDVSQPENGRVAFNQDNNLVYRPVEGFSGQDLFRYTVSDKHESGTATATARINVREPEIVSLPKDVNLSKTELINFIYDEVELTEISKTKVKMFIDQLKQNENLRVEIYTYTDNIGSDNYNISLAGRRAEALKNMLTANGIDSEKIVAIGMGEAHPIANNSTPAGQAINRRAEFVFKAGSQAE